MCRLAGVGLMEAGLGTSAPRRSVCLVDTLLHVSYILLSDPSGIDKHALHVVLEEPQEENAKRRKTMSPRSTGESKSCRPNLKSSSKKNHTVKVMTPWQEFSTSALLAFGIRWSFLVGGCPMNQLMFSSIPGLYTLEAPSKWWQSKCLQTSTNVP